MMPDKDMTGRTEQEALFVARRMDDELGDRVTARQRTGIAAPVIPADLGPYLQGRSQKAEAVQAALGTDLSLRRLYTGLLRHQSRWSIPRLAAADSGFTNSRESDALKITMTPSKRDKDQIFLRITVKSLDAEHINGPARLSVTLGNEDIVEEQIDDMMDGDAQLLLAADHALIAALQQADSEFFLTPLPA